MCKCTSLQHHIICIKLRLNLTLYILWEKKRHSFDPVWQFRLQILEIKTVLHSLFVKYLIWNKLFSHVLIFLKRVTNNWVISFYLIYVISWPFNYWGTWLFICWPVNELYKLNYWNITHLVHGTWFPNYINDNKLRKFILDSAFLDDLRGKY